MSSPRSVFIKAVQEELQEKQRLIDATNSYNHARDTKRDKGLVYYNESLRKEIYEQAKLRGFSAQDLEKMSYYLSPEHWNQDEVFQSVDDQIVDAVDLFYKAEQFLNANTQKHSFRVAVFDFVSSLGGHMDKEDELNDN